jgi:PAS domain S-box-containing protein
VNTHVLLLLSQRQQRGLNQDASDAMLRAVLDQSPDCIKILSRDRTLDYMNKNGQCAMEIDDFSTVAGQPWASLWPSHTRGAIEEALDKASRGEPAHLQAECPTAKGTPRWWDVSVTGFKTGSGQTGFISISRDVTKAVHAQQTAEAIPECKLAQAEVDALSMVLGELCVNSIKHGALSASGHISITGTCDRDRVGLRWSERSDKAVGTHVREGGQGLKIMQRVLAARNGSIKYDWHSRGVDVQLTWKREEAPTL